MSPRFLWVLEYIANLLHFSSPSLTSFVGFAEQSHWERNSSAKPYNTPTGNWATPFSDFHDTKSYWDFRFCPPIGMRDRSFLISDLRVPVDGMLMNSFQQHFESFHRSCVSGKFNSLDTKHVLFRIISSTSSARIDTNVPFSPPSRWRNTTAFRKGVRKYCSFFFVK